MDKQHRWLVKQYHMLCTQLGLEAHEKADLLSSYGAKSSLDLSVKDLQNVCMKLEHLLNPKAAQLDQWRKRVMAAIGAWLKLTSREQNAAMIKAIACRASGYDSFNKIPQERLVNLYAAFTKKQKDFKSVREMTAEDIEILAYCN